MEVSHKNFLKIFLTKALLSFSFSLLILIVKTDNLFSQENTIDTIYVDFSEKRIGRLEIQIIIKDKEIYLPLKSIFDFLRIRIDISANSMIIKGFFIDPDSIYEINLKENRAIYNKRKYEIFSKDYILSEKEIFLHENFFKEFFNLDIKYNPRKLEVTLKSSVQFPIIKTKERERKYRRIDKEDNLISIKKYERSPKYFSPGRLGYNLTSRYNIDKSLTHNYHFYYGGQILFGDADLSVKGILNEQIKERNIRGNIKYPFFNNKYLGQITIGDLKRRSFIAGSIFGIDITNTPAEQRRIFSKIQYKTQIFSDEELFLSSYRFESLYYNPTVDTIISSDITLSYGINEITTKKYDWYGVEKYDRKYIVIPQSMIPPGELDYKISVGRLRQRYYPWYGGAEINFGATKWITLGAGLEYLDKKDIKSNYYPYTFSTVKLSDNIYGIMEFSPFVNSRLRLSWQTYDQKIVEFNYEMPARNSFFNPREVENSTSIALKLPFMFNRSVISLDGIFTQNNLSSVKEYNYYFGFNSYFKYFSINYGYNGYSRQNIGNILNLSSVGVTIRPTRISFITFTNRFDHIINSIISTNIGFAISIKNIAFLNFSAERNYNTNNLLLFATLTITPPFLTSQTSTFKSDQGLSITQNIRGEIIGSLQNLYLIFQNRSISNRGYFLTEAFLDENQNGIREKNEKILQDVKFDVVSEHGGGILLKKRRGGKYFGSGFKYTDYIFSVRKRDLEDPFWVPLYEGILVQSEPNQLKTIRVPIVSGTIIRGIVSNIDGLPISGIDVILMKDIDYKKSIITTSSGEFEFPTVAPGEYIISVDKTDLLRFDYIVEPEQKLVSVSGKPGEEYITVDFTIKPKR